MPLLLIALILVPLTEIAVFIQVGGLIGLAPTLLTVVLTAVIGAVLLRRQGLHTVQEAQAKLNRQEPPIRELFDGLCLFAAGAFLLTPGFITDFVGFLLLVPPVRLQIARLLWQRLINRAERRGHPRPPGAGRPGGSAADGPQGRPGGGPGGGGSEGPVIDADFEEIRPGGNTPDSGSNNDPGDDGNMPPRNESRWGRGESDR
ncbi:FxsA family protein [Fodinicurvata sp. EGI_FJ10296]|uniref:FxsA family protein n=1 Tax=Fodinicurvata sp. EGI_FJ10296 TaxID=3231908 RepID=UPI0034529DC8